METLVAVAIAVTTSPRSPHRPAPTTHPLVDLLTSAPSTIAV